MAEIVLHIGTPKTGTTAIQQALSENEDLLAQENIIFIKAGRQRAAHNDLANAISRHGADNRFQQDFDAEFAAAADGGDNRKILLSSEIFSLVSPRKFHRSLPQLNGLPMKIVVYLRRHDQYVEAFYKQRLKNGRTTDPFDQFLQSRICQRITNYNGLLDGWANIYPEATIVPRIYDRASFVDGDIVADFASILGLGAKAFETSALEVNVSPSKEVIDILLALSPHFSGPELRNIFRNVKSQKLDGFSAKGDLFNSQERLAYCARFEEENDALRKAYFPTAKKLFPSPDGAASKSSEELGDAGRKALLDAMLAAAFEMRQV